MEYVAPGREWVPPPFRSTKAASGRLGKRHSSTAQQRPRRVSEAAEFLKTYQLPSNKHEPANTAARRATNPTDPASGLQVYAGLRLPYFVGLQLNVAPCSKLNYNLLNSI